MRWVSIDSICCITTYISVEADALRFSAGAEILPPSSHHIELDPAGTNSVEPYLMHYARRSVNDTVGSEHQ